MTANSSRSSSPVTPDSLSDDVFQPSGHIDLSAWCHSFSPDSDSTSWDAAQEAFLQSTKASDDAMLFMDGFLRDTLLDSAPTQSPISINPSVFQVSPQSKQSYTSSAERAARMSIDSSASESMPVPDLVSWPSVTIPSVTRPVPPPPTRPRRAEVAPNKVIYPPKESCRNLAIVTPTIPLTGTKSRVETQVRVQLDLAHTNSQTLCGPKYDRVGSWKWLKLPKGTATRLRSRKEGKIEAIPEDILYLQADVNCSTAPYTKVVSCATCKGREAKRVARKIAARVRPPRTDVEAENMGPDDSLNVLQFNCPDLLDFQNGTVVLPLRITCYCRHHREKVGFNVHFNLLDHNGQIVGKGVTPPIMITDDHKTTALNASKQSFSPPQMSGDIGWNNPPMPTEPVIQSTITNGIVAPSKRSKDIARRRPKPYEDMRSYPSSRQRTEEAESASTSQISSASSSVYSGTAPPSPVTNELSMASSLPSPPNSYSSPSSSYNAFVGENSVFDEALATQQMMPLSPTQTAPPSPFANRLCPQPMHPTSDFMSLAFGLKPEPDLLFSTHSLPRIHRLIPSSGPTYGGIEVTILGANFHANMTFNCVFGDAIASSTSRWSDNTLVCILPPQATSGVVPVSFQGMQVEEDPRSPALFTYIDEADRALMELALQVVGLKMTGKLEDAKNVAMRIVGTSTQDQQQVNVSGMVNMSNMLSSASLDIRRLLSRSNSDAQQLILDFLSVLDSETDEGGDFSCASCISQTSSSGQTLLHLATFMNLPVLVKFLIEHGIDVDARDLNGFTALHFAALVRSSVCASAIIDAGADVEVVDAMGRTYLDIGGLGFAHVLKRHSSSRPETEDEGAWGDAEEDSADDEMSKTRTRVRRRRSRRSHSRHSSLASAFASRNISREDLPELNTTLDDDDNATVVCPESPRLGASKDEMEKPVVTPVAEFFQRAWAQLQPQYMVPQIPQIPQLRGMPAWVFPVFVPIPAWPAFRGEKRAEEEDPTSKDKDSDEADMRSPSSEWKTSWEKWITQTAALVNSQREAAASEPTVVQPSATSQTEAEQESTKVNVVTTSSATESETVISEAPQSSSFSLMRRFGYGSVQITDGEVNSFTYQPKRASKGMKKEDKMLVFFWIPILILALGWALYTGLPLALRTFRHRLPASMH